MNTSNTLYQDARTYIPGGVNSPVRAFGSVGGKPLFIKQGKGSKIIDVDGNEYVDCVMSWGPLILGHAHPAVIDAVCEAAQKGTSFGAPTEAETDLARMITELVPSIEKVRLVNSGTEATMSAVRLARGYTGKDRVIKFAGCYHGHADSFLIKGGSGALTFGHPSSPGVTKGTAADTLSATYNDIDSVQQLFQQYGEEIAAIIVEPVAGNMGVILPNSGFLNELREITTIHNALLIFDEVITGFRLTLGGAQQYYGIQPDLTTLGKIIGGGLPVGAFGGKAEIMDTLAPDGPIYQAGTLSGNPLAVAAGLAVLNLLKKSPPYEMLQRKAEYLFQEISQYGQSNSIDIQINAIASMGCIFFSSHPITSYGQVTGCNTDLFTRFHRLLLDQGVYCAPSQFEALFISTEHGDLDLEKIIKGVKRAFEQLG